VNQSPLVSVIIPTYNRAKMIGDTIENVFEQTYQNIELIVVDDGSTDDTKQVLAGYDGRLQWTTQPNAGASAARNRGVEMARGEIVAFQDSDDLWHPSKIQRQVSLLERVGESVVCCICNTDIVRGDVRVYTSFDNAPICPPYEEGVWTNAADVLATRFFIFCQAVAIRRRVIEKIGGFDERLITMHDHEMAIRLAQEGPWAFIRTLLVTQRQGTANSISRAVIERPVLLAEENLHMWKIIQERSGEDGGGPLWRETIERQLRNAKRGLKITRMTHGRSRAGRVVGSMASGVERIRTALGRRLPGYPKMKVQAIEPSASVRLRIC